jgi:hypothetical protein
VLLTRSYSGDRTFERAWRVYEFRRILPKVGVGQGLVQFWGESKCRHQDADGNWTPWTPPEHKDPDGLCTVEIGDVIAIKDPKR